ncbi:MAG: hypothetical protein AB7N80_01735 [Bdellovibrionales bacterium]
MYGLFAILSLFVVSAQAEMVAVLGGRPGYLTTVSREREQRDVEMVIIPPPPKTNALLLGRPLVDPKLTREFQNQYETRFGRSEVERNYNSSNRFTFYEYPGGRLENLETHEQRQRQFGEFMFRRLTEHHVDQYAKSNPDIRPIYELKDRIANIDVKVRQGYKLRFKYSYSGNFLDVRLENPYDIATKVSFQMGSGFGPSNVERTIYSLSYPVSKITTISAFQEVDARTSTSLMGARRLNKTLSATLTASHAAPVDRDLWETSPRQNLMLLGFSWTE